MKKKLLRLVISLFTLSTNGMDMLSRACSSGITPQKISFFSRDLSDKEDIATLLRAIKEFLYEQGLYDAAEIVITLEKNMAEKHTPTLP